MRSLAPHTWVETVDNAVDLDDFPPGRADGDPPTVLFVGVICRRKGLLELARAGRALHERGTREWKLVVVGGQGPTPQAEYDEILAEFDAAGIRDSMVGPEYGDQIKSRLAQADIFVLPSFLEGQPIAIIEAMASGLAVVGTSIGAVPDLIRDGIEGRLVEPGDAQALAEALGDVIEDPAARRKMAHAARERAELAHGLDRLSARLGSLYRAVLAGEKTDAEDDAVAIR